MSCGRHERKPSGCRRAEATAVRRTTIKNEHRYEPWFLVPAGFSRRMFRCFGHTSSAAFSPYFYI
jgi:hypothetical protein